MALEMGSNGSLAVGPVRSRGAPEPRPAGQHGEMGMPLPARLHGAAPRACEREDVGPEHSRHLLALQDGLSPAWGAGLPEAGSVTAWELTVHHYHKFGMSHATVPLRWEKAT